MVQISDMETFVPAVFQRRHGNACKTVFFFFLVLKVGTWENI